MDKDLEIEGRIEQVLSSSIPFVKGRSGNDAIGANQPIVYLVLKSDKGYTTFIYLYSAVLH